MRCEDLVSRKSWTGRKANLHDLDRQELRAATSQEEKVFASWKTNSRMA